MTPKSTTQSSPTAVSIPRIVVTCTTPACRWMPSKLRPHREQQRDAEHDEHGGGEDTAEHGPSSLRWRDVPGLS